MTHSQEFKDEYISILKAFAESQGEQFLAQAYRVGRKMLHAGLQPDAILEIHQMAVQCFAEEFPDKTLLESIHIISAPLMETLIAYSLAFSEMQHKKKRAEKVLKESEEKFRALYENAPLAYHSLDEDGCLNDVNPAWLRLLGYDKEEVIGERFSEFLHPDCKPHFEKNYSEFKESGHVQDVQCKIRHKGGHYLDISVEGRIGYHPDGSFNQTYCVFQDITEEKLAQEALKQSENNYKAATEAGQIAVWRVELPECTADSGGTLERLLGYELGEINDWKMITHPEDQDRLEELWKRIYQKKIDRYDIEQKLLCKDGNFRWFLVRGKVVWDDATKGVIIGTTQNINERKINEQELQKLSFAIEQSSNAVMITDLNGNIEYVNPMFAKITGYTAEEVLGQNPRILKSGETPNESYKELWETISSGKTWMGEFHNRKKNGELYWEKATISPIRDSSGKITNYLAIKEDITTERELERERKALEADINQAHKLEAVGSLASGIAHEINTPIQFVGDNTNFIADSFKSLISLIESYDSFWQKVIAGGDLANLDSKRLEVKENADFEYLKEEIPSAIEQTLEGVQRVTKIVRAMKDFAHSDQGTMVTSDINDMLESTLTVARNELKYVANVETDFDNNLPDVECYRDDLNQVFLNLLINAAHAIEDVVGDGSAGKGTITVSTLRDNDNVVIKISDTGKGIPKSIQDRIFDPFFSTKEVGKGTGQGLAIALKIVVDKHQGSLDFETEEGKGTTFIIRLPIAVKKVVDVT